VYTWLNIKKYKNKIKDKHAFNTNIIKKKIPICILSIYSNLQLI
jgi:hypothetical protein